MCTVNWRVRSNGDDKTVCSTSVKRGACSCVCARARFGLLGFNRDGMSSQLGTRECRQQAVGLCMHTKMGKRDNKTESLHARLHTAVGVLFSCVRIAFVEGQKDFESIAKPSSLCRRPVLRRCNLAGDQPRSCRSTRGGPWRSGRS